MQGDKDTIAFKSLRWGAADFLNNEIKWFSSSPSRHRGIIDGNGIVTTKCSTRFLLSVALQLLRARAFGYVQVSEPQIDAQQHIKRCRFLELEVARLVQYPALFPSECHRGRFFALLAIDADLSFAAACKDLLVERELRNWHSAWRAKCRPHFMPGSKDWENFLFNHAPGTGIPSENTNPKSCFQVVPGVAMAIAAEAEKMERGLIQFVRDGSLKLDVSPAQASVLTAASVALGTQGDKKKMKMNRHGRMNRSNRSSFRDWLEPQLAYLRPGPEPLQGFPPLMRRLERHPMLPPLPYPILISSSTWTALFLRSWHARHGKDVPKPVQESTTNSNE